MKCDTVLLKITIQEILWNEESFFLSIHVLFYTCRPTGVNRKISTRQHQKISICQCLYLIAHSLVSLSHPHPDCSVTATAPCCEGMAWMWRSDVGALFCPMIKTCSMFWRDWRPGLSGGRETRPRTSALFLLLDRRQSKFYDVILSLNLNLNSMM